MKIYKLFFQIFLLLILVISNDGCQKLNSPQNNVTQTKKIDKNLDKKNMQSKQFQKKAQAITVIVSKVKKEKFSEFLDLSGSLAARNEIKVYSDVSGKVAEILKIEGNYISKDEPIVMIDRSQIGANYTLAPVKSPINGYILSIFVTIGQNVAPGSVPIASIGNISQIDLNINVPERYVDKVKIGQKVYLKVPSNPNKIFEAEIYRKDLSLDTLSHTLLVRAKVNNINRELLPGMYADASILIRTVNNVFVLPNSAIFKDNNRDAVYVNITNKAVIRYVNVLFSYKDKIAIDQGINEGEEVIIFGKEFLKPNISINPIYQEEGGF